MNNSRRINSLLGEELSESEEGYARSEEEGWYYADD